MKTIPTVEGKIYCVATSTSCEVTTEAGTLLGTAEAGQPLWFQAQKGDTTTLSDDNAEYSASRFNLAPQQQLAAIGVLGGNDVLPRGYTQLDYIESTGTQYIDTGVFPKGSYTVKFSVLSRVWDGYNNSNPVFFSFESAMWYFYSMNWQGIYLTAGQRGYGNQRYSLAYPPMHELNIRYDIVCDKNKTIRNGVELEAIAGTFEYEDFAFSRISILLFNRTDVKTQPTSKVLYNFSIEDNGNPVVNYIPALTADGQTGMFDKVSGSFKGNVGGGYFIAGIDTQKRLEAVLRALPDRTGLAVGTLQVRLADDLQTPENEARLDAMLAKNWEISQAA